jgi:hypothetical protein
MHARGAWWEDSAQQPLEVEEKKLLLEVEDKQTFVTEKGNKVEGKKCTFWQRVCLDC